MKGGKQNIELSRDAWRKGTIMHEICHALGMLHEQCRADRDNFVRIDFSGMSDDERYQYKTYVELGFNGRDFGKYDYVSIMHYGTWLNGKEVMWKVDGSSILAQRFFLTETDIASLAALQPGTNSYGTFYDPLGCNTPVNNDYEYIRSKFLKLPDGGDVTFRLQYKYNPSNSILGMYSIADFNMNLIVSIRTYPQGVEVFSKTISLPQTSSYIDLNLPEIHLTPNLYTTELRLLGSVNGTSNSSKLSILRDLMYNPVVFLHLNSLKVNKQSLTIPSGTDYDATLRRLTLISIE